mgnify:CR=1 FL=1
MKYEKTLAPNNILEPKQYKLTDFVEEFSAFAHKRDNSRFGCLNDDKNLIRFIKKGKLYFKNNVAVCPSCGSSHNTKNGYQERKLILLGNGEQECSVQKYKCKSCGKTFSSNLSALVYDGWNVTIPVIKTIERLYSNYGAGLHKIKYDLIENHKVDLSHQEIQNILLLSDYEFNHKNWSFSGHYLFDSLWIKIKGQWNYLLTLFDTKSNTIVAIELVESEDYKTVHDFLRKNLANQKKYSIGTDLKREYRKAIQTLGVKHHFCKFHVKQLINREIKRYLDTNKVSEDEKELIKKVKKDIFKMLDADDIKTSERIRNGFFNYKKEDSALVHKLLWKLVIPYFKNLTYHIENEKIETTNNKIENSFQKIFPKHIKKTLKKAKGVLKRFMLKLQKWNLNNKN